MQKDREQKASDKRAQTEREIAQDNQQEAALQEYIDKMSELLLNRKLRESAAGDEVRTIAHAQTLTTLSRLDKVRKGKVLQFLLEAKLLLKDDRIVDLENADFSHADLRDAVLLSANLSFANLREADLRGAILNKADLSRADLSHADLRGAHLYAANLANANLIGADLRNGGLRDDTTNLSFSDLSGANLTGTDLKFVNLDGASLIGAILVGTYFRQANLSFADLSKVKVTFDELDKPKKPCRVPKPPKNPNAKHCSVPACEDYALCRGVCHRHYESMRLHGTLPPKIVKPVDCAVASCHGKCYAKNLCRTHYARLYRHGTVDLAEHRTAVLVHFGPQAMLKKCILQRDLKIFRSR